MQKATSSHEVSLQSDGPLRSCAQTKNEPSAREWPSQAVRKKSQGYSLHAYAFASWHTKNKAKSLAVRTQPLTV